VNYLSLSREESVLTWGETVSEKRSGEREHFFGFRYLIGRLPLTNNGRPGQEARRCHF